LSLFPTFNSLLWGKVMKLVHTDLFIFYSESKISQESI
jgi:hypothetical protein